MGLLAFKVAGPWLQELDNLKVQAQAGVAALGEYGDDQEALIFMGCVKKRVFVF